MSWEERTIIMVMGRAGESGILPLHGNDTVVIYLFIHLFLFVGDVS